jgi:hypothetical protein
MATKGMNNIVVNIAIFKGENIIHICKRTY